jgi:hypothetical protein
MRSVVVLPAPLGPRSAVTWPVGGVEADAVDGADVAESLVEVLDADHCVACLAGALAEAEFCQDPGPAGEQEEGRGASPCRRTTYRGRPAIPLR